MQGDNASQKSLYEYLGISDRNFMSYPNEYDEKIVDLSEKNVTTVMRASFSYRYHGFLVFASGHLHGVRKIDRLNVLEQKACIIEAITKRQSGPRKRFIISDDAPQAVKELMQAWKKAGLQREKEQCMKFFSDLKVQLSKTAFSRTSFGREIIDRIPVNGDEKDYKVLNDKIEEFANCKDLNDLGVILKIGQDIERVSTAQSSQQYTFKASDMSLENGPVACTSCATQSVSAPEIVNVSKHRVSLDAISNFTTRFSMYHAWDKEKYLLAQVEKGQSLQVSCPVVKFSQNHSSSNTGILGENRLPKIASDHNNIVMQAKNKDDTQVSSKSTEDKGSMKNPIAIDEESVHDVDACLQNDAQENTSTNAGEDRLGVDLQGSQEMDQGEKRAVSEEGNCTIGSVLVALDQKDIVRVMKSTDDVNTRKRTQRHRDVDACLQNDAQENTSTNAGEDRLGVDLQGSQEMDQGEKRAVSEEGNCTIGSVLVALDQKDIVRVMKSTDDVNTRKRTQRHRDVDACLQNDAQENTSTNAGEDRLGVDLQGSQEMDQGEKRAVSEEGNCTIGSVLVALDQESIVRDMKRIDAIDRRKRMKIKSKAQKKQRIQDNICTPETKKILREVMTQRIDNDMKKKMQRKLLSSILECNTNINKTTITTQESANIEDTRSVQQKKIDCVISNMTVQSAIDYANNLNPVTRDKGVNLPESNCKNDAQQLYIEQVREGGQNLVRQLRAGYKRSLDAAAIDDDSEKESPRAKELRMRMCPVVPDKLPPHILQYVPTAQEEMEREQRIAKYFEACKNLHTLYQPKKNNDMSNLLMRLNYSAKRQKRKNVVASKPKAVSEGLSVQANLSSSTNDPEPSELSTNDMQISSQSSENELSHNVVVTAETDTKQCDEQTLSNLSEGDVLNEQKKCDNDKEDNVEEILPVSQSVSVQGNSGFSIDNLLTSDSTPRSDAPVLTDSSLSTSVAPVSQSVSVQGNSGFSIDNLLTSDSTPRSDAPVLTDSSLSTSVAPVSQSVSAQGNSGFSIDNLLTSDSTPRSDAPVLTDSSLSTSVAPVSQSVSAQGNSGFSIDNLLTSDSTPRSDAPGVLANPSFSTSVAPASQSVSAQYNSGFLADHWLKAGSTFRPNVPVMLANPSFSTSVAPASQSVSAQYNSGFLADHWLKAGSTFRPNVPVMLANPSFSTSVAPASQSVSAQYNSGFLADHWLKAGSTFRPNVPVMLANPSFLSLSTNLFMHRNVALPPLLSFGMPTHGININLPYRSPCVEDFTCDKQGSYLTMTGCHDVHNNLQ